MERLGKESYKKVAVTAAGRLLHLNIAFVRTRKYDNNEKARRAYIRSDL